MNKGALALLVAVILLGLAGCQPALDTNRNLAAATSSTPAKGPVDKAAIEVELLKLEREWGTAIQTHNAEAVRQVLAEDAVIHYPDGTTGTKADEVQSVESGAATADGFEVLDPKVTVIDGDSAFITGRSIIKNGKYKDPKQKKAIDISGEYRFLDVYAKRDGKWQAVASQATKIANPTASPTR